MLIYTEEYTTAINDYYTDKITKEQVEAVARAWELNCDLSGWTSVVPNVYTWNIDIEEVQLVLAGIDLANCSVPMTAKVDEEINISIAVKNIGSKTGLIYYKIVESPNTVDESIIDSGYISLDAGTSYTITDIISFRTSGIVTIGAKVWGEDEVEPGWGISGKTVMISTNIPRNRISALSKLLLTR